MSQEAKHMNQESKYVRIAYELGCRARKDNVSLDACTYSDPHMVESWEAGWRDMNKTIAQSSSKDGAIAECVCTL